MTSNPKVSIIVPIYNCEENLKRAIDSLVNQTLKDIEIILVNDGSTDNSESICKNYLLKYDNVKYFYQSNSGVSAARNKGITEAKGDYIMFLDADDYYNLDAAELLYNKMLETNVDLVCGGIDKTIYGEKQQVCFDEEKRNIEEQILLMTNKFTLNQVWGKLWVKNIIINNGVFFNETLSSGEDLDFVCRYLKLADDISCVTKPLYNYQIVNSESLSQKFKPDYFEQRSKSFSSLEDLYKAKDLLNKYVNVICSINAQNIWAGLMSINAANCNLSFKGKIDFINSGLNSYCYSFYLEHKPMEFSKSKKAMLNIKNPYLLTLAICLIGKIL